MNKIILMGRLTKDPAIHYTEGENPIAIARYDLAVDRKFKRKDGIQTDFFHVIAFDWQGDFAARYLRKGTKIVVSGRVQTGSYEKDGVRRPTFEVVAEEQEFAESKNASAAKETDSQTADGQEFMTLPDDMDELPFE